jgi:hypothetical protein
MTRNIDAAIHQKRQELESLTQEIAQPDPEANWWSPTSAMTMSSLVLLYGLFTIALATWLIKAGKTSESILRVYGTIMIIVISVFLVVAGYSNNQIAPVTGLLGTIAGYLLGKGSKDDAGGS